MFNDIAKVLSIVLKVVLVYYIVVWTVIGIVWIVKNITMLPVRIVRRKRTA